jgi:5-methylcytosine-specific restriction protein A
MPISPTEHTPFTHRAPKHESIEKHDPKKVRSSTAQGYGYRWQQARAGYFSKHPLCVHCQQQGLVTIATDLDHIVPHHGDMVKFWQRDNWQGLCAPCHSRKTAKENGGFGNKSKI